MYRLFKSSLLILFLCLTSHIGATQVHLIWQMDRKNTWEEDWIMELLSGLDINVIDDGSYTIQKDLSIIVSNYNPNLATYIKGLREKGLTFGIIITSDEAYSIPTDFYQYANFVFRNYWHPNFVHDSKIIQFPLGYKNKFWQDGPQEIKPASQRKYVWSFAGRLDHHYRANMIQEMRNVPNYHLHQIHAWADARSLSTKDYRNLMLDTIFIPCARGCYNLDSFRLYEALECGCIPVVEKVPYDYFGSFFGNHPFIAVSSWTEAPRIIQALLNNPAALEAKREACYEWWQRFKKNMNTAFVTKIKKEFNLSDAV